MRLKEKGYIPSHVKVKSGTISKKAGRYYVSVLVETEENDTNKPIGVGLGIDLGIKDFATDNTMDKPYLNINKTKVVKAKEKKLKREQRRLSRKYEGLKKRNKETKVATRQNIQKPNRRSTKTSSRNFLI